MAQAPSACRCLCQTLENQAAAAAAVGGTLWLAE